MDEGQRKRYEKDESLLTNGAKSKKQPIILHFISISLTSRIKL
jgi:hypothetical protein